MTDPIKRPFKLPAWHIPYLEKHKIYELFHEIARELVIQKPDDHVLFMKQILQNAANCKNVSRILLLNTHHVDCLGIAKEVAKITGSVVISDLEMKNYLRNEFTNMPSEVYVKALGCLIRSQQCYSKGWIIVNCIRDEEDAKNMIKYGILPTHTILIIAPFNPDLSNLLYCDVKATWPNYRRTIVGIKEAFRKTLIEFYLGNKQICEVVQEITDLPKQELLPSVKRVLIIGPRGSGRKTQAKLLENKFNMVHIDFERLLCSSWISPNELGDRLRKCKNEVCFHAQLLAEVINKRILEHDCLTKGWVLTGFPFTQTDFKHLDSLDTPPNRVIFLECDINICKERLHRKVNVFTGSTTNIKQYHINEDAKILKTHPKDESDMIVAELNFYCENYGSLRKYCGETASLVNGVLNERHVHEYITAILLRSAPPGTPRAGLDYPDDASSISDCCQCLPIPQQVLDCYIRKI